MSGVRLLVATFSFSYVVSYDQGKIPVMRFASIAALITFLLVHVIVMLGMIGEYLWRVFDEVNQRPEVINDAIFD